MVGQELSDEELEKYGQMAAFATGVSADKIVVTTAEFVGSESSSGPEPAAESGLLNLNRRQMMILAGICGGVFLLMIALIILFSRKRRKAAGQHAAAEPERPGLEEMLSGAAAGTSVKQNIPGQIVLNETREQALKRQITEFSGGNPEIVAQLLRTWLKEDEDNGGE
jgi:flagellar M-ring protein FliF